MKPLSLKEALVQNPSADRKLIEEAIKLRSQCPGRARGRRAAIPYENQLALGDMPQDKKTRYVRM